MIAIILAEYLFVLPILIGGVYFLLAPTKIKMDMVILSAITLPLTVVVMLVLNQIYDNPRPDVLLDFNPFLRDHFFSNGFPSTHATLTALIAAVMYVFNRRIGIFLLIMSILISLSRVYLELHHLIDIVGGIVLACLMTFIIHSLLNKYFSFRLQK